MVWSFSGRAVRFCGLEIYGSMLCGGGRRGARPEVDEGKIRLWLLRLWRAKAERGECRGRRGGFGVERVVWGDVFVMEFGSAGWICLVLRLGGGWSMVMRRSGR